MQFKNLAFSAFAATALAQGASQSEDLVSIFNVLQTALPSSLVNEALTNSAAVSSQIASQFAAGATPTWFTALPSDIQTYLVPAAATGLAGSNGTSNGTAATNGTIISGNNSTSNSTASTTSTRGRATMTNTNGGSHHTAGSGSGSGSQSSGAGFQGSSSESGNAAAPTAFIGAGLAGAVGLVGLLAL